MPDYIGSNGRTEEEIANAEKELNIKFAEDYREYLKNIGLACFDGHELTGLTKTARLDVALVTKEQRAIFGDEVRNWYVVEELGINSIVIWQDSDGLVYAATPNSKPKKVASSLFEYITK